MWKKHRSDESLPITLSPCGGPPAFCFRGKASPFCVGGPAGARLVSWTNWPRLRTATVSSGDSAQCCIPDKPVAFDRRSVPVPAWKMMSTPLASHAPRRQGPVEERGGFSTESPGTHLGRARGEPASADADWGPAGEPGRPPPGADPSSRRVRKEPEFQA